MQAITNVRKNTAGHTQKEASLHPQESLPSTHTSYDKSNIVRNGMPVSDEALSAALYCG